jgi:hypothetical protein
MRQAILRELNQDLHSVKSFLLVSMLGLVPFVGSAHLEAQSEVTTYTPERIQWQELAYKASKFGIKAASDVRIRLLSASEASKSLIEAESESVVEIGDDQVAEIEISNLVRGTNSVSTLLIDPQSGAAYQRSQVSRSKKKNFLRTYRYLADGVFVERRNPTGSPTGSPWGWPIRNTRTIPFASGVSGKDVTEAMALFYILTAADFNDVGDTLRFYNFDRDGMTEVLMTVEELVQWKVDYQEVSTGGQRRVKETREVARLTISGHSVGNGEDAFEFLGLRGEIEIFADLELRIPLAVRGKVPVAGNMTVGLNRLVLK